VKYGRSPVGLGTKNECAGENKYSQKCEGSKKLFTIDLIVDYLNSKFSSLCRLKDRLGFKRYIPLKATKFRIKCFKLCPSSARYLWSHNRFNSSVLAASKIVVTFFGTIFHKRVGKSYISLDLSPCKEKWCKYIRGTGTDEEECSSVLKKQS
jgi:hypothetical protein